MVGLAAFDPPYSASHCPCCGRSNVGVMHLSTANEPPNDESERRLLVGELEQRARELQTAFDAVDDALWVMDADCCILRANKAAAKLTGKHAAELCGLRCWEAVHGTAGPIDGCPVARMKKSKKRESMELVLDGRWFEVTVDPLFAPDGRLTGTVHLVRDITEHKRTENELKSLNDTLEIRVVERAATAERRAAQLRVLASELTQAEERERHRMARILHDELQQILVAAKMKASMLRNRRKDDLRLVDELRQIEDLIGRSIEESRSLTSQLSPPVLYDAGLLAGLNWLARQLDERHGHKVTIHADPNAEPDEVGQRVFLYQAVRELLRNAVRHSQDDSAHVDLSVSDDGWLRVVVTDDGVGFDPASLEHCLSNGCFGLFSLRERLEVIGGRISVTTSPGTGTRVSLEVPRVAKPAVGQSLAGTIGLGQEAFTAGRHRATARRRNENAPLRVLVADDHPVMRKGLAGELARHPRIDVVGEAADGREACQMALDLRPDVVLMDVSMPRLNGIEATRRILAALPGTQVLGLSMHEEADMESAMRRAGAAGYLRKDTGVEALVAAILDAVVSG
jgi:PAS domain S-box-containing protein